MPYLVIKTWYPTHLASEVAKRYLEIMQKYPPAPELGEVLVPVAAKTTKKGIRTMSILEVKAGKLEEADTRYGEALARFNDIKGYEYSIERWGTISESMATMGMKPPERYAK